MTAVPPVCVIGGCSSGLTASGRKSSRTADSDVVVVERNRCLACLVLCRYSPGFAGMLQCCTLQTAEKEEIECDGPSHAAAGTVISAHHNTYEE